MTITPLYAGLLVFWFLVLSWRVIRRRGRDMSLGDGGDGAMLRVIRGHANFAEYVPLALLLMAILELCNFSAYIIHGMGAMLLTGRLLHGYALSFTDKFPFGRFWGTALTFVVLSVGAVLCLYQAARFW